jgi:hypothetical protein
VIAVMMSRGKISEETRPESLSSYLLVLTALFAAPEGEECVAQSCSAVNISSSTLRSTRLIATALPSPSVRITGVW